MAFEIFLKRKLFILKNHLDIWLPFENEKKNTGQKYRTHLRTKKIYGMSQCLHDYSLEKYEEVHSKYWKIFLVSSRYQKLYLRCKYSNFFNFRPTFLGNQIKNIFLT